MEGDKYNVEVLYLPLVLIEYFKHKHSCLTQLIGRTPDNSET